MFNKCISLTVSPNPIEWIASKKSIVYTKYINDDCINSLN
jgi:hypothetical protein